MVSRAARWARRGGAGGARRPLEKRAGALFLPAREAGGMFPEPSPSASEGEVRRECPLLGR